MSNATFYWIRVFIFIIFFFFFAFWQTWLESLRLLCRDLFFTKNTPPLISNEHTLTRTCIYVCTYYLSCCHNWRYYLFIDLLLSFIPSGFFAHFRYFSLLSAFHIQVLSSLISLSFQPILQFIHFFLSFFLVIWKDSSGPMLLRSQLSSFFLLGI